MFSCVWLHFKKYFKKYFLMFGCVLENTIENTFCTCCSHFLIFSRLPNEYIISFIPQNTKKKPKKKKIIKSGHFARSRLVRRRDRDRRSRCFARSVDRDRSFARSARCWWCRRTISASSALDDLYSLFFLSPSLSFSCSLSLSFSLSLSSIFQGRKSFEVKIGTKMNFRGQRYYFTINWKWFLENLIFQTNQTAYFTENDFLKPFSPKTNTA